MNIAVCARIKDSPEIICDWVAHYMVLGFDKIFIYDNMSNPSIESTLRSRNPLLLDKVEIMIDLEHGSQQTKRYNECLKKYGNEYDWILLCDDDEFLDIRLDVSLKDYLKDIPSDVGTILINWICYGHGNQEKINKDLLIVEQFITREPYTNFWSRFVKSFVRPSIVKNVTNVHFSVNKNVKTIDGNKRVIDTENFTDNLCELPDYILNDNTELVMMHYMTRDIETMLKKGIKNEIAGLYAGRYTIPWYNIYFKDEIIDEIMPNKYAQKVRAYLFP